MNLLVFVIVAQLGLSAHAGQIPGTGRKGPGLPLPGRSKKSDDKPLLLQMVGFVRSIEGKTLVVATADSRMIEFRLTDKTQLPEGLKTGDYVEVETTQGDDWVYTAVNVRKTNPPRGAKPPESIAAPPPGPTAPEEKPEPPSTIVKAAPTREEGEGPPRLRRGVPPKRAAREPAEEPSSEPVVVRTVDPTGEVKVEPGKGERPDEFRELLDRARKESEGFLSGLPNYLCKQFTTRFTGEGKPTRWKALDVVSADLVFEDGRERYQNLAINGKAVKGKVEDTGTWSTGEFGTVLRDVFSPATRAVFKFAGSETIARTPAASFSFTVERSGSHWKIGVPGQFVEPAYKGMIWIDKATARVLRIEMQARQIPKEFPKDTTEMAIDYDWVTLGGTQKFLMPVKSEVLSCTRDSDQCERNQIEFRNYRKFGAQSDVIFK